MGSESDLGVAVLAVAIEEFGALLGVEVDAAFHACVGVSLDGLILPFYDPKHFPVCGELFSRAEAPGLFTVKIIRLTQLTARWSWPVINIKSEAKFASMVLRPQK